MAVLSREIRNVQNPALGCLLIAAAAAEYRNSSTHRKAMPIQLAFVLLPIVLHPEMQRVVSSTQKNSGLRAFAEKLSSYKESKSDLILAIQSRALEMRPLTFRSLRFFFSKRLGTLQPDGGLFTNDELMCDFFEDYSNHELVKAAAKVGAWFSQLSMFEITSVLKVAL